MAELSRHHDHVRSVAFIATVSQSRRAGKRSALNDEGRGHCRNTLAAAGEAQAVSCGC